MKFILGKKQNMTRFFLEDGRALPVTKIIAGPCFVTAVKKVEPDGYNAVQVGFGKKKVLSKALQGHLKNLNNFRYLKEFTIDDPSKYEVGDKILVNNFKVGDKVKVTGKNKGKGFQGVVKRHGFHGSPASHGHKDQLRMPGSIGATDAARVFKGKRMGGHMGDQQVTVANLEVVKVTEDCLYVKGAVPGARGSSLVLQASGELEVIKNTQTDKFQNNAKTSHKTVAVPGPTDAVEKKDGLVKAGSATAINPAEDKINNENNTLVKPTVEGEDVKSEENKK